MELRIDEHGNVCADAEVVKYCDIYDCKDCPRYGDDCDGEFDDEEDIWE